MCRSHVQSNTVLHLIEVCAMVRVSFCPPLRTPAVQCHAVPFLKILHSPAGPRRSPAASLGVGSSDRKKCLLAPGFRLLLDFEVVQTSSRASGDAAEGAKSGS